MPCSLTFFFKQMNIFFTESFATLTCTLPNGLKWLYRYYVSKNISSYELKETLDKTTKTARLFIHGPLEFKNNEDVSVLLMLHGDYGHPFSLLNLCDKAKKAQKGPIFSIHMPFDRSHSAISQALLRQAFNKIEQLIQDSQGCFKSFILAGHSKGAIQAAYHAFVDKDPRIKAVISIAGRLKVVPSKEKPCHKLLKPTVQSIYKGIKKNPQIPLFQIVAEEDWNAPYEASSVRSETSCLIKNAMHLNVLYRKETAQAFKGFLLSA